MALQRRQEKLTWALLKSNFTRDNVLSPDAEVTDHVVPTLTTRLPSLFIKSTRRTRRAGCGISTRMFKAAFAISSPPRLEPCSSLKRAVESSP